MENQNRPFFEALSYETYQSLSKQTMCGIILFFCTGVLLIFASIVLFRQWTTIRSETVSFIDQKKQLETMELEKKDLAQKLSPFHKKSKKMMRLAQKLTLTSAVLENLFLKSESVQITSCLIKKKKLVVTFESSDGNYASWTKKIFESKLLKNVVITHIKKNEFHTVATIEADIIF